MHHWTEVREQKLQQRGIELAEKVHRQCESAKAQTPEIEDRPNGKKTRKVRKWSIADEMNKEVKIDKQINSKAQATKRWKQRLGLKQIKKGNNITTGSRNQEFQFRMN